MKKKIRVGLVFGGPSTEHEVSLRSAKNIYQSLDKNKYEVHLLGINKEGQLLPEGQSQLLLGESTNYLSLTPIKSGLIEADQSFTEAATHTDVLFPIIHGRFGEDGVLQGLAEILGIAYVGPDILGSAICLNKDITNRLLQAAGLSVLPYIMIQKTELSSLDPDRIMAKLGPIIFVKPVDQGSSVGVSKVTNPLKLKTAIEKAFLYSNQVMVQKGIKAREVECSVLGNDQPIASLPGEIIVHHHQFYDYEAKYLDPEGADLDIPAKISPNLTRKIQRMAVKAYQALGCKGMSRVDFLLDKQNKLYICEVNTIPGFTDISMYPKLWQASGISQSELVDKLITLALEEHQSKLKLKRSYDV